MSGPNKTTALSVDLNSFIYGVSRRNFQNSSELTKIGITLLKNFPAARDAVLEYFAMVFHEAVNISINQSDYEGDSNTGGPLESVSVIGPELINLGESWAPIIAPWCINLIMDIATDKANLPNATLQNSDPVRVLLDITTQNLTLLNNEERAKCIDMMIGCRACSWAVGWVGRVEPALVAPRALALGPDAARAVLAHLAHHPPARLHLRNALKHLFEEAIKENAKPEKKRDVIPYLLNLASKSDIVLKALTEDIEKTLTGAVVDRLVALQRSQQPAWEAAGAALLPLLQRCPVRCLLLLLQLAAARAVCRQLLEHLLQKLEYESLFPDSNIPMIASATEDLHILQEKLLVGNQLEQYSIARILILVCCESPAALVSVTSFVLQHARSDTALALLVRVVGGARRRGGGDDLEPGPGAAPGPGPAPAPAPLQPRHLAAAVQAALRGAVIADTQIKMCLLEGNVQDRKTYVHHFCLNVIKLLRWENSGRVNAMRGGWFGAAVWESLPALAGELRSLGGLLRSPRPHTHAALNELPTCHALAEVLDRVDLSGTKCPPPSVEVIVKLLQAIVLYFFRCLHETDILVKIRGVQTACRILRKLCLHSKLARAIALRDLLETAMFKEEAVFGSKSVIANTITQAKDWTHDDLLLNLNQKHGPITQLTQSHTSVFHAGIIGRGVRRGAGGGDQAASVLHVNNELLMGALMSCMEGSSGVVEGSTAAALLLVELVAPDVMYNGLPWPDEDFTKQVSIERELYMRSAVERSSTVQAVLRRAAAAPPALCLASALLRAVAATLLHTLRAMLDRHSSSAEMRRERGALAELLSTMALGQLLPRPLCHMLQLAPDLTPSEIVQMLRDCVWNYTRDHVPSPALFTCDSTGLHWRDPSTCKPPATYTDTLRLIIQKKISTLGHLYPIMFLNLEKDSSTT